MESARAWARPPWFWKPLLAAAECEVLEPLEPQVWLPVRAPVQALWAVVLLARA